MLFFWHLVCYLLLKLVVCNVEKVIFTAPPTTSLPLDASIDNLLLIPLNHDYLSVRTSLNASFPTDAHPKGTESWLLLDGLTPGQRYEVRVCWLATQPTAFWLHAHPISQTFDTPMLISSLTSYAFARHGDLQADLIHSLATRRENSNPGSIMFLQIYAAADYFSLNKTLMENVPPVMVDIILDPYLLGVFPQSLVPTALHIVVVAFVAWFLSAWIFRQLHRLSMAQSNTKGRPRKRTGGTKIE